MASRSTATSARGKTTLDEVLRLFAHTCDAVQFAYQRGIVHREQAVASVERERAEIPDRLAEAMLNLELAELDRLIERVAEIKAPPELAHAYRSFYNLMHFDLDGAKVMAEAALRIDPDTWVAHVVLASVAALRSGTLSAGASLTRALQAGPADSIVTDAARASVLTLLRKYDEALLIIEPYRQREGAKGLIWIECYARWFRLLRDPQIDLQTRLDEADRVNTKFDSASYGYGGRIPFVSDARADVHIRLALLYHALGQTARSRACAHACREDSDHLVSLGAPGCANRHLSEISMWCGKLEESAGCVRRGSADVARLRHLGRGLLDRPPGARGAARRPAGRCFRRMARRPRRLHPQLDRVRRAAQRRAARSLPHRVGVAHRGDEGGGG